MRESNIKLYSNVHVLAGELEDDKELHSKVKGRKALKYLLDKVLKEKDNTKIALNNLQIAELNHAGVPLENCKFKKAWGIVVDRDQNCFVECRCDYSECPQYNICLNTKVYLNDTINNIDDIQNQLAEIKPHKNDEPIDDTESLAILATDIEREVNTLSSNDTVDIVEVKNNEIIDEQLLMNCLVSIERITGDIVHLKDITERLEKDVSEIRTKIHEKLAKHKRGIHQ